MKKFIHVVAKAVGATKVAEASLNSIGTGVQSTFVKAANDSEYHAKHLDMLASDKKKKAEKLISQASINESNAQKSRNFANSLKAMFDE
jgi:hypothetical protein